jgi:hypothetical protein
MKLKNFGLFIAILAGLLLAAWIIDIEKSSTGKPVFVTPFVTKASGHGQLRCDYKKDMGCGIPNAHCARSRVGLNFMKADVVYTCKGPKPYKWRR